ncbi:hypothetical protein [Petrachloros mirabilis]
MSQAMSGSHESRHRLRGPLPRRLRFVHLLFISGLVLSGSGCAAPSLDMSDRRIPPPGPDGGVVIGSVLVQAEQELPDSWFTRLFGRNAGSFVYEFEIVRTGMGIANKSDPYKDRYVLDVQPGEERFFVAHLPVSRYVFKSFHHKGLSAMGGEVGLTFSVAPGTTVYIGRLLLEVPGRVTLGTSFTYRVENAREATLVAVRRRHPEISLQPVDAPMQTP